MKNSYKWLIALLVIGFFGVSGLVLAADVPKGKEVLKLNSIKGKKGPLKFPHAKHVKEFKDHKGKAIACKTCHHTAKKNAKKVKKCTACHVAEGQTQKEHKGKKAAFLALKKGKKFNKKTVIFHKTCIKCHKKVVKVNADAKKKKIDKCKGCHKKK